MIVVKIGDKNYIPPPAEFAELAKRITNDIAWTGNDAVIAVPGYVSIEKLEVKSGERAVIECGNCGCLVSPSAEKCPACGGYFGD